MLLRFICVIVLTSLLLQHVLCISCNKTQGSKVAACSIIRDWPREDLIEWLEYHLMIGVTHFIILEHRSDNIKPILDKYVNQGVVTYGNSQDDVRKFPQISLYEHCVQALQGHFDFVALIDADEYIVLYDKDYECLNTYMENFINFGALGVNWIMFGSSGHEKRPPGASLGNYIACSLNKNAGFSRHVKLIVNTKYGQRFVTQHQFTYNDGKYAVDENMNPILSHQTPEASWDHIAIHHYQTKSREDYVRRMSRGHPTINPVQNTFDSINNASTGQCTKGLQLAAECCADLYQESSKQALEQQQKQTRNSQSTFIQTYNYLDQNTLNNNYKYMS
eukprot:TRINITY_DN4675_c0_g1_i9.p1 TRINITY_DN4675_c0_g1~~TRINITY_DN4675_c0_g1_i9.p1  ORF type:complete len:344 (-),score=12.96 TRINITY_DN4675_c0_g1_i9:941-1942(-)